jgi:hypothetical protein
MRSRLLVLVLLLQLMPAAICQSHEDGVDMTFKMKNGQFFTPEFSLATHWYDFKLNRHRYLIDLYTEADLSNESSSCCLIDVDRSLDGEDLEHCTRRPDQRVRIRWKLWKGNMVVAQGPKKGECSCETINIHLGRDFLIGNIRVPDGKAYRLELDIDNVDPNSHFTQAHLVMWPQPEM